jgi:hypothetical protein
MLFNAVRMSGNPDKRHPAKEFALFVLFMAVVTMSGFVVWRYVSSGTDTTTPTDISSQSRPAPAK